MNQPVVSNRLFDGAVFRTALFAFVLTFLCVGGAGVLMPAATAEARMKQETLTLVTATGEKKLTIEVTVTDEDKALGLMFRTSLADNAGMLFPYAVPQEIGMWMKNTYIPLDMVFIRADGIVHRIEAHTTPLSETVVSSNGLVVAVLELAAGNAARLGLKPGDRVAHPHFKAAPKK